MRAESNGKEKESTQIQQTTGLPLSQDLIAGTASTANVKGKKACLS